MKSDDPNYATFGAFWQNVVYYVEHFCLIVGAFLKEVSVSETTNGSQLSNIERADSLHVPAINIIG